MSYTKTNWQTGDVITQEKLNHMEDGIAGSDSNFDLVLAITNDGSNVTFEMSGLSFDELAAKITSNKNVSLFVILTDRNPSYVQAVATIARYYPPSDSYPADISFYFGYDELINSQYYLDLMSNGEIYIEESSIGSGIGTWTYNSNTKEYTMSITVK